MTKVDLFRLLRTTQDQNILWYFLLQNNYNYNFYISLNPNCSLEILKILSKSEESDIRRNVVLHLNCSIELLTYLSKDKNFIVKFAIINCPNWSIELLKHLIKDDNPEIRFFAERKLNDKRKTI